MGGWALKRCAIAAVFLIAVVGSPYEVRAALSFYVEPNGWPDAPRRNAAVNALQAVVNRHNAYGDFGNYSIYAYYNSGIPTAQAGYLASIGYGGTYPNERVTLHESNHYLGSGTYAHTYNSPRAIALMEQFEGIGAGFGTDGTHFWPYGMNYDNEWNEVGAQRNIAIMYALRGDWGIGPTSNPTAWAATTVNLNASDPIGTSGFNYGDNWNDNTFAHPNANYSTGAFNMRTPQGYPSWTFAGNSLTVNSGGRLLFNGWGTTGVVTIKNLTVNGGTVRHDQNPIDLFQLAGNVTLTTNATFEAANGDIKVLGQLGGSGSLTKTGAYTLTVSGGNSYSGATVINAGTLRLSPPAPVVSYSFANVSGTTVINDGTGGSSMNGTLNANGGSGFINPTGGPSAGTGALVLNGTATTVDVNSGVVDLSGDGNWTVSTWIKTTQAGATIFNKGDGTNWNSGYSTFYLSDGSSAGSGGLPSAVRWGGGWLSGSTAVNNGNWHHITYTNSAGTKTVYVDGVISSLGQNEFLNSDTGSAIRIGYNPPGQNDGEQTTNGSLSGIKFFSTALSASQVAQLYSNGQVTSVLPTTTNVTIAGGSTLDVNGAMQQIGSLTGSIGSAVKLGKGGQLNVSSSDSSIFSGNISGTGSASLTKSGSGTLTLSGANNYTGPTTISGGTLRLSNPEVVTQATPIASYSFANVSSNTVVNEGTGGASMNGTFNANGGSGSISTTGGPATGMGALMLNGTGSTVDVNSGITNLSSSSNWSVSAWVKTTQAGATILNKGDGVNWNSGFSTFYLGDGSDAGSGGLPTAVRWGGGWLAGSTAVNDGNWHLLTYTDSAGTKTVYVDGVAETLTENEFLNTDTGTKVRIGFAPTNADGELPTNGSLSGIKLYNSALTPGQVAALFGAVIGNGGASATALPTGTDLTIAAGAVLDVNGVSQTIGSLSGPTGSAVTLGAGQLTINSATGTQFAGTISGSGGSFVKAGADILTLTGANTYTGATTISGGTLRVSNTSGSGTGTNSVVVSSGGTLGGTGTIAGTVIVNSGGYIAPGASIESLDVGSLTLASGSILDFELDTVLDVDTSDLINVTNSNGLTVNGGLLNLTNLGSMTAGTYKLIDYLGSLNGSLNNIALGAVPSGFNYTLLNNTSATSIDLVVATLLGDYNSSGTVDTADYVVWRKNVGQPAGALLNDNTGVVIGNQQYSLWRSNFGNVLGSGSALGSAAVPEPASFVIAMIGLSTFPFTRQGRQLVR